MKPRSLVEWAAYIITILTIGAMAAFILFNSGCMASVDAIRSINYQQWTADECMTVIMANTSHNLRADGQIIYALVTPFTPEVVQAIGKYRQHKYGLSDSLTYEFVQRLTKQGAGTFIDRQGVEWDSRGNRFQGHRDSLMFMVNLMNKTWPCDPPKINGKSLLRISEVPCETPNIAQIDRHMYLYTASGDTVYPKTVWGRRGSILMEDENLLVIFDLRAIRRQDGLMLRIDAFDDLNHRTMIFGI